MKDVLTGMLYLSITMLTAFDLRGVFSDGPPPRIWRYTFFVGAGMLVVGAIGILCVKGAAR